VPRRKRVLSGMRPTGRLHIGHYFGALKNWIELQEKFDCFYFVADWHALTTDYADASQVARNSIEIATDWLAAGLDPEKCTMFVQSEVPGHAELHLLLSMVTPLGWLERVPTYKEQLENIKDKDLHTYGFLGYPLLQAADIVIYDADFVPVGEDQVPHVELTREIVRRFNVNFGLEISDALWNDTAAVGVVAAVVGLSPPVDPPRSEQGDIARWKIQIRKHLSEVGYDNFIDQLKRARIPARGPAGVRGFPGHPRRMFPFKRVLSEPGVLLTETPRLPGTDGRKMSKSYNNFVSLSEPDESIRTKTRAMMTDPARTHRHIPGNPDICPVFAWHKLFSTPETIAWSDQGCRTAGIGCIECKQAIADGLIKWIAPVRARRAEYEAQPERVREILREGTKKAQRVTKKTMRRVREAVFGAASVIASPKRKSKAAPEP
jgi:tryptophanyl-tRNA synthetase